MSHTTQPHTTQPAAAPSATTGQALIELTHIHKNYGAFHALSDINLTINAHAVTCVLGDNGAGKSTLIKILSGLDTPSSGTLTIDGKPVALGTPKNALDRGIATVYQDLAVVGSMPVWRNFFLGQEKTRGPLRLLDVAAMRHETAAALWEMGVDLTDVDIPIGRLSGGQRQVVAIARAIHFGARVVILDEPTAALGVKQSGMVLRFVAAARSKGIAVVMVTHNPHHAMLVGDYFVVLTLGEVTLSAARGDITVDELALHMAGGGELSALEHELRGADDAG